MKSLREVLELTEKRNNKGDLLPFNISFFSWNSATKKGGEFRELKNVVRCGTSHNQRKNNTIGVRFLNSNHHIIPIHIHLIMSVNGNECC